ncbi:hypothetical protein VTO73DRAFT_5589 [Trametes versicolor]
MSCFSRVIARPITFIWEDAPLQAARDRMDTLAEIWETLPNVVVNGPGPYRPAYGAYWSHLRRRAYYADTLPTYVPLPNRENDPVVPTTRSPRRRDGFARTDSTGSMPSLMSDEPALDSPLSCSPVLSPPGSPPPTGFSATAFLGSPGYLGGFADEQDARPDLMNMQLKWREHFARMGDESCSSSSSSNDSVTSNNCPPTPGNVSPLQRIPRQVPAAPTPRAASKTSRLSQRVRTPPALNTRALKAETLLAKLLRGSYDVEVGHTDGSALSDAESGFEGDDESDEGLAGKGAAYEQSYGGYALCEAGVDRDQRDPLMKKTYAAVAAAASWADDVGIVRGEAAIGAGVGGVEGTKDWTSMFERRGPLVEVVDV